MPLSPSTFRVSSRNGERRRSSVSVIASVSRTAPWLVVKVVSRTFEPGLYVRSTSYAAGRLEPEGAAALRVE